MVLQLVIFMSASGSGYLYPSDSPPIGGFDSHYQVAEINPFPSFGNPSQQIEDEPSHRFEIFLLNFDIEIAFQFLNL